MTLYTAFLPDVVPFASDCPEIVALQQVRNAAIEFCRRTDYVRHEPSLISVQQGVNTYALTTPSETEVMRLMGAYFKGRRMSAISEDALRARYMQDWRDQVGTPAYFLQFEPKTLVIVPKPEVAEASALRLLVSLRPTRTSQSCPDELYESFVEVIAAGARARLYEMRGQSFYDPDAAAFYRGRFMQGVSDARVERNRSLGRPTLVCRPVKGSM